MALQHKRIDTAGEISTTPLIDVMLVLLVMFFTIPVRLTR
jgi:biopolymer transport protein ExbD